MVNFESSKARQTLRCLFVFALLDQESEVLEVSKGIEDAHYLGVSGRTSMPPTRIIAQANCTAMGIR
jgi:hypothetical protein